MKNNTQLTPLEIEQVREAIREYAEEFMSPVRYIVIEELATQQEGYDFVAVCLIYFNGDREEGHVLGMRGNSKDGFTVPLD